MTRSRLVAQLHLPGEAVPLLGPARAARVQQVAQRDEDLERRATPQ